MVHMIILMFWRLKMKNKNTNKSVKKQRKVKITTIIFLVIDLIAFGCFFLFYGPYENFRNLIITTALDTKTHQYIAYTFWSEDTINKVIQRNAYIPIDETINLDDIKIDPSPKESYDNPYDEIILTRDPGNEDYKYIPVKVGKYDAHLVAIYDPTKVELIHSKSFKTGTGQEQIASMCKRFGGVVCINGGQFVDYGLGSDIPMGYLIKDGRIIWSDNNKKSNLIGFTNDGKLLLTYASGAEAINNGMKDALEFGPFLIVNGKKLDFVDQSAGGYSRAARVAIGQRRDGIVLFLVTEGTHANGPNLKEVIDTLSLYGAYNAANLDGGTSAQLTVNGKLMNHPKNIYGQTVTGGRRVVSGFGLVLDK